MTRSILRCWLGAIFLVGVGLRAWAWRTRGAVHYDEFFQVLEPSHWRLTGAGMLTWEWIDGLRSWVLPGYHGAWMALLRRLGVDSGATIGETLQLHWAVVNALIVLVAFHGAAMIARRLWPPPTDLAGQASRSARPPAPAARPGPCGTPAAAGWQAGVLAALLCALFPHLCLYAPHTLSENPATLAFCAALALACAADERARHQIGSAGALAAVSGGLFSLGVCLKIAWAPLALVGPILLLVRRRFALVGWMIAGAVPPVILFGLVDLLTWGTFLGSFVTYLDFNVIDGKAAKFGVEPWHWYFKMLHERLRFAFPLLLIPAFAGWRATWPWVASAGGLLALLSTQGHKEERFILIVWPLLLIAAAGVVGGWFAQTWRRARLAVAVVGTAAVLADAATHAAFHGVFGRKWLQAQAAAARDPEAIAFMTESSAYTGGMLWSSSRGPVFGYDAELLKNEMFTHVVVRVASDRAQHVREMGFEPVRVWDDVVLMKRRAQ